VLSRKALDDLRADYRARLDDLSSRWKAQGLIDDTAAELPLERRFKRVVEQAQGRVSNWIQFFNIALPSNGITRDSPIHLSRGVFRLLTNPRILDIAETLVGPEVSLNPIGLVRIKLPEADVPLEQQSGLTAQTVWHQDRGVGMEEFNRTRFVTVWIPITETTEENGCLRVIPGSHRGDLINHCPGGVTSFDAGVVRIPDVLLPGQPVSVPMLPGDVLLLDPLIVHSSYSNRSDAVRWSFDLRYQRTGDPSGRPEWPTLPVRSRRHPEQVATFEAWRDAWLASREKLAELNGAALPHRWDGKLDVCG
jgi:hypothetical protein